MYWGQVIKILSGQSHMEFCKKKKQKTSAEVAQLFFGSVDPEISCGEVIRSNEEHFEWVPEFNYWGKDWYN